MYCKQIKKGTWRCVSDAGRDPVTGKRRQFARSGKTKREAETKVQEAIFEADLSTYSSHTPFSTFADYWLELYTMRGNKETTNRYRAYTLSLVKEQLGNRPLDMITTDMLQNLLGSFFTEGRAYHTLRGVHNVLKMLFDHAYKMRILDATPMDGVFVPKKRLEVKDVDGSEVQKLYLENHELKIFLDEVAEYRNIVTRTLIFVLAFTGMRPGEAIALQLDDINYTAKTIRVNKTMFFKSGIISDFEVTPPKTLNSVRIIDVDDIVLTKLQELAQHRKRKRWAKSKFVFAEADGSPRTVKLLNQTIKRISARTSIGRPVNTYMLRHTHISLLAEAGIELTYIMNRVGHQNSKTTTNIYLHITQGMRSNASEKMENKFSDLLQN